jgi:uncharacterized protein
MITLSEAQQILASHLPDLSYRYPIARLGIFGSLARGEAQPDSDIDLLVEFNGPIGLEFVDLAMELEQILGEKVDLVSLRAIKDRMLPYVQKDLVYVAA